MALALTPTFVFAMEKRMEAIREEEFARALHESNNWWSRVAKTKELEGAAERITWFLNTAKIEPVGLGGHIPISPMVTQSMEIVPARWASGISVNRDQLLDLGGTGLDELAEWSGQIGVKIAYHPQFMVSSLIMNGANTDGSANAYDGVPFFADNTTSTTIGGVTVLGHPYNPYQPTLGGYFNWLHGSASGAYPGALPIDATNAATVDVAFNNLAKAIAYVGGWKMPDGITPRFVRPRGIIVPPAILPRATEILDAKYIAQAAGSSGGGSADIAAIHQRWGFDGPPIEAQEFAATTSYSTQFIMPQNTAIGQQSGQALAYNETITGSDTTYYLVMEQNRSSVLGGLIHVMREAFKVNYFSGDGASGPANGLDAILNRALEIEYHCQGRSSAMYGHPYALVRVDAT